MVKKQDIDVIEEWIDKCYVRAREEKLCGSMLEILEQKDRVKKLLQADKPLVVKHVIEEIKVVKPLTTKIREFVLGSE